MNFSSLVTSSVLLRALALFIVALAVVLALVIGAVELLAKDPVSPIVWTVAGSGVITSWTIINVNFGVVLQPAPPVPAVSATTAEQNKESA